MLWFVLIASILGFWAVTPLATTTNNLPTNPEIWAVCSLISLGFSGILAIIYSYQQAKFRAFFQKKTVYLPSVFWQQLIIISFILISVLLASSSYGLYRFYQYQKTLLKQPITITATIKVQQISDNVAQQLFFANANDMPISIGNGYQRQIWQIVSVQPFDNQDKSEPILNLPMQVLVTANTLHYPHWQTTLNKIQPNQTVTVKLALQPILQKKFYQLPNSIKPLNLGFDEALWLRQRGIQAKAQLIEIQEDSLQTQDNPTLLLKIEQMRWQFRQKILQNLQQNIQHQSLNTHQAISQLHAHAILLGLLTGDRGLMGADIRQIYQVTGISHLLAISGPHVMMLASIVSLWIIWLIKMGLPKLLLRLPSRLLMLWTSVVVSIFYAFFVGFELPAQRTVFMLLLVTLACQWLIPISAYRLLAWVGLIMIWLDTTAVTQAGFWLSFVAVGLLMIFSQISVKENQIIDMELSIFQGFSFTVWQSFKQLFILQLWLFVCMLPVTIWFFGKVSLLSILVNLIAVPLLGLVIVPLDMLAGLLSFLPVIGGWLSQGIWGILAKILILFHNILQMLIEAGLAKQWYFSLTVSQMLLLLLILLIWLGRGVISRLVIIPLIFTIIAIQYQFFHQEKARLIVLDDTQLSISLLIYQRQAWLILADNDYQTIDNQFSKHEQKIKQNKSFLDKLDTKIYPLLAFYHIHQLVGIINQTPSLAVNDLVQQLVKTVPTQHYWLAGFDPLKSQQDIMSYSMISPKSCQIGQQWQEKNLQLSAVTGWQLNLSLNHQQRWQTQTCFVQIQYKDKRTLIVAGDDNVTMQMSEKLCLARPTNRLIIPYQTPLSKTWLQTINPKQIHVITGSDNNQQLSFDNQLILANITADIYQSGQLGSIEYRLDD